MTHFTRRTAAAVCALLLFASSSFLKGQLSEDWPAWGGPNGNFIVNPGVLEADQPVQLKVAWKRKLGSGYSAISVTSDIAVTMYSDSTFDYLTALDPANGAELWHFKIDSTFPGRFGSANGPISTPLISRDRVVGLSAAGRLFALNRKSGKLVWESDLAADFGAPEPFYGFSTSPLLYNDILIVETGGLSENAITAFDPDNGKVLWSAKSDTVEYQSPYLLKTGDGNQLIGITNRSLYGLQPETGKQLWKYDHGGNNHPMGASSGNLVHLGNNQFFFKNKETGGKLLSLDYAGEVYQVNEVWQTTDIKGTYIIPVYHDGYIYGYNSRIFVCVDAQTGKRVWRSRAPGDGFPIIVDNHLVVITKSGKLSIAPASPEGYQEIASIELLDNLVWTPASFAHNRLFLRSFTEIASVEIAPSEILARAEEEAVGVVPNSKFAKFVKQVEGAEEKQKLVEEFMQGQETFPVIEGDDVVHFVCRAEAQDMALMSDLIGWRTDRPMHRVADTDLFYYSSRLEPDARLNYKFMRDFQARHVDSLNARRHGSMFYGFTSWFNMPKWKNPDYLEASGGLTGRIDSLQFKSVKIDSARMIEVYLPAGYDDSKKDYPVIYLHEGRLARALGNVKTALDNLIGRQIQPVIVVFMPSFYGDSYEEMIGGNRDAYAEVFVEEILPKVETMYRVRSGAQNRLNMGNSFGGFMAFYTTFKYSELFANFAAQSMYWDEKLGKRYASLISPNASKMKKIYFGWGKYDFNSPFESINIIETSRKVANLLQSRGYEFAGGEANLGTGWTNWKTRLDEVLTTFFPLSDGESE